MQLQVHQTKTAGIWDVFSSHKSLPPLKMSLLLREFKKIVSCIFNIPIGRHEKSTSAGRRVLNRLTGFWLYETHNAINERSWREILTGLRFLFACRLLKDALVPITE